jgi:hypothetical protein
VAAATLVYDGRVKAAATKADFDTATGPFGKDFVKGQSKCFISTIARFHHLPNVDLTFSQLVAFPNVECSIFDSQVGAKAVEVQIKFVFQAHLIDLHTNHPQRPIYLCSRQCRCQCANCCPPYRTQSKWRWKHHHWSQNPTRVPATKCYQPIECQPRVFARVSRACRLQRQLVHVAHWYSAWQRWQYEERSRPSGQYSCRNQDAFHDALHCRRMD